MPVLTHLAIIMDGNGRWAKARGLSRSAGHKAGTETAREVVRECRRLGIPSDHRSMYAVMFGWPAVRYARAVQREAQGLHRVRLGDLEGGL